MLTTNPNNRRHGYLDEVVEGAEDKHTSSEGNACGKDDYFLLDYPNLLEAGDQRRQEGKHQEAKDKDLDAEVKDSNRDFRMRETGMMTTAFAVRPT
jgi:hypothetical protein